MNFFPVAALMADPINGTRATSNRPTVESNVFRQVWWSTPVKPGTQEVGGSPSEAGPWGEKCETLSKKQPKSKRLGVWHK
jgi:hypothetical protein